jgi:hypothetical protein
MRTLKPGFFTSEDVVQYSFRARLLFAGLWTYCDDHGRGKDNPRLIKGEVWPLDDDVTYADVEEDLQALHAGGAIVRYRVGGSPFLAVQNWHFHQSPNHPSPTKLPDPPVPVAVPEPGQPKHCAACWTSFEALRAPSRLPPGVLSESETGYPQRAGQEFTEDSGSPHVSVRVGGGGGIGEGVGGGGGGRATAPMPPAPRFRPRCQRHRDLADDDPGPNCRDCRDVRVATEKAVAAAPSKPPWCGECDPDTRQVDRSGRVGRCHVCHPLRSVG